jgi:putative ABC transport system permease protein
MLTLATLRERWTAFVGTFVALCLGVAILSMTALVLVSAQPRIPARYAGAPVLVQSHAVDQGDDAFTDNRPWSPETTDALVQALALIPGVAAAVPDRSFYVQAVIDGMPVGGADAGDHQGHAWASAALAPYRLVAGRPPAHDGEVVLNRGLGLRPGTRVTLLTAAGPAPYTVSGVTDAPGFYVCDAAAASLAGGVRVIGLVPKPDADRATIETGARTITGAAKTAAGVDARDGAAGAGAVRGAEGSRVLSGDARAALELKGDAKVRWIGMQILVAMAGIGGFVSVFVVASTFAFGVAQRRREFGLLRTVGATPRQVRGMVYGEALAVGVVAAGVGVLLGTVLAPVLGGLLVDAGLEPRGFAVGIRFWPLAASYAAGLAVAMLGVWAASRRAAAVPPLEALREAAVDNRPMTRGRWIAGGAFTAAGLALIVFAAASSADEMINNILYAAMALIVGSTLLAPAIIPPVVRAIWWPFARLRGGDGAIGMLVRESALTAVRRTASTAAPVLVTVGFAVLIAGMFETRAGGYALEETVSVRAAAVAVPHGTPGLSDAAVAAVTGASLLPTTLYDGGAGHLAAEGIDPAAFTKVRDRLRVLSGSIGGLRGDDAMVARASTASRLGWRRGSVAPLTFEDGRTVSLRVVAVVSDDSAATDVLLTRDAVRAHDPSALTGVVYLTGAPRALPAGLGARVVDVATYAADANAADDRLVRIFILILIGMSLGYTAIAIANTLMMATAGRLRDLKVLRLSGATTRQVLWSIAAESALVVGIGAALGMAIALAALLGIRTGLSAQLGATVTIGLPWPAVLTVIATCLLIAVTASVLPARYVRIRGVVS